MAVISRLRDLDPAEPVHRYEREYLGDMIQLDIKRRTDRTPHHGQLERLAPQPRDRLDYVHVCIDDAARPFFN